MCDSMMKIFLVVALIASIGAATSINVFADEELLPSWIKTTAGFWSDGHTSDQEFVNALQWLVNNNIIKVPGANIEHPDNGDFHVTYLPNPNSIYGLSAKEWIQDSGFMEENIAYLNETYRLPYDIEVILRECGEANAYYFEKELVICYEFIDMTFNDFEYYYEDALQTGEYTSDDIGLFTIDMVDFAFYHEIAHALIEAYELPITGSEESAADQFATLSMLSYGPDEGNSVMLHVTNWYLIKALEEEDEIQNHLGDIHELRAQTFYNLVCYMYGQDPILNKKMLTDNVLTEERAESCPTEYAMMYNSWNQLLQPIYK